MLNSLFYIIKGVKSRFLSGEKILFIFIFIVGQNFLFAQYRTLPDSNAVWVYGYNQGPNFYYSTLSTPVNKEDTLINTKFYTKLLSVGAYRSDTSGKAWFVPKDSIQEYLLMDLSKNVGDTLYNLVSYYGGSVGFGNPRFTNAIVDSVSYINIGPYLLKRLTLHGLSWCTDLTEWHWVEKIGSTGHASVIFNYSPCGVSDINMTYCMSFNDTIYYQAYLYPYSYGTCSIPNTVSEIALKNENVNIYPTPFSSSLNISFNNKSANYGISIYNSQGVICKTFLIQSISEDVKINLSELVSGLYLIKIEDKERNSFITKKIIKE